MFKFRIVNDREVLDYWKYQPVCFLEIQSIYGGAGGFGFSDSQGMDTIGHSCKTHGCCAKSTFMASNRQL